MNLDEIAGKLEYREDADETKIKHQKNVAKQVLEILHHSSGTSHTFKTRCPEAIIAGGAPRNWWFNKPANDLDFYIKGYLDTCTLERLSQLSTTDCQTARHKYSEAIKTINYVSTYTIEGISVQIICVELPNIIGNIECTNHGDGARTECPRCFANFVFETFDFGICKIAQSEPSGGTCFQHPDFINDYRDKTLTLRLNEFEKFQYFGNLPERLKKMQKYFPGHKVVFK